MFSIVLLSSDLLKRCFLMFSIFLFFLAFPVSASPENDFVSEKMGTVSLNIGTIEGLDISGTGIIINKELNIITNYHVIESIVTGTDNLIQVCFTYTEEDEPACFGFASVEKYDEENDLALLNVYVHPDYFRDSGMKTYYDAFVKIFAFELNETIGISDKIYVFGYPGIGGNTITYTSGEISGFENGYIKTDVKISSGNSGGGAYNSSGQLIGIATAVSGGQGNIGWLVSAATVRSFLIGTIVDTDTRSEQCGDHSYKIGRYESCICEEGFTFDALQKNCIPTVRYQGCGTMESLSFFNPIDPSCYCYAGYEWKFPEIESDYSCISLPEKVLQEGICQNGENNILGNDEQCLCIDGYVWEFPNDAENYNCISLEELEGESCTLGENNIVYNKECSCLDGFHWEDEADENNYNCIANIIQPSDTPVYFRDVSSTDINFNGIQFVREKGFVQGYEGNLYLPGNKITRAEFTKIILLAQYTPDQISNTQHSYISDVGAQTWYYDYINFAKQEGIVSGYADGTFHPNDEISYAEASKIIVNTLIGYKNIGSGAQWWKPFTNELEDFGLEVAFRLQPEFHITRGDMASLIYGLLKE